MSNLKQEIRYAIAALDRGSLRDVRRHLEAAIRDDDINGWQLQYASGKYFRKKHETKSFSTFTSSGALRNSLGYFYGDVYEILNGYVITPDNKRISFREFCEECQWVPSFNKYNWIDKEKPEWFSKIESSKK